MTDFQSKPHHAVDTISRISVIEDILEVVCRSTGMGFAAVAHVTNDQWIACAIKDSINFGLLPGGELKLETTICHEIQCGNPGVVIDNVAEDVNFAEHHTPKLYGFQSYISMPITLKDGSFFGTLCAIDPKPAKLNTPETIGMFKLFTELIAFHLDAIQKMDIAEEKLLEERHTAELRDQFIAILGHDLRNPIGAIRNSAQLLLRMPLDDRSKRLAQIIQDSSFRSLALIENILDFARGRLGEGITLNLKVNEQIEYHLSQILTELRSVWPNREIIVNFDLDEPVVCDGTRIAQLFSNLLGNALTYGTKELPVRVNAISKNGEFTLEVANSGDMIPNAIMERLFHPFSRGTGERSKEGLGLGLYIASEIASAHGGTLNATSSCEETCFTLLIPSK